VTDQIAGLKNAEPGKWRTRIHQQNNWLLFARRTFIFFRIISSSITPRFKRHWHCVEFTVHFSRLCPLWSNRSDFEHKHSPLRLLFYFLFIYVLFVLKHIQFGMSLLFSELIHTMILARYCCRKSSVRPSIRLSVRDVDVPWAYRLDYSFKFIRAYTNN